MALGADLEPDTVVSKMLESRDNWTLVKRYVNKVLATKEEEERTAQRSQIIS